MGEKGKEIQVEFVDTEKDELLARDSGLEMEMLELFEDITLEDVVASKACVGKVVGCKDMPASVVKKILAGVWRKLGYWRMKKCDDGVLGFFFEEEEDYHFVMEKRPWIINGVLLNLKPWPIEGEPTMVIPTEGPAVPMYGTWIKSDTGRSNCFNMRGKGTIRSMVVREEAPEWDVGKPYRRRTWKRNQRSEGVKITTATSSSEGQVLGPVTVTEKDNDVGQKRKFVQEGNAYGVQNVEIKENVQLDLNEVGPNFLDLPTPDFSFGPEGSELIPDIGPTIAQSLDIPHSWLCRSQTPHDFPEPTHIKWPNDDLEAQKMFFQLYGPDANDLYKAQASLICNPPDLSMMIVQLLGSKKRKPHTWYHPYPAVTSFSLPECPVVEEKADGVSSTDTAELNNFSLGTGSGSRPRRSSRKKAWKFASGVSGVSKGSGVKTRRGRRIADTKNEEVNIFSGNLEVVLQGCGSNEGQVVQNFGNGEEAASSMPPPSPTTERTLRGLIHDTNADLVFLAETKVGMVDMEACMNRLGFLNVIGIPSEGIGGGFCLAWRVAGLIEVQQVLDSGFHVVIPEINGGTKWHLFCIYGTPYVEKKKDFWKWLTDIVRECREPWVVLGDLNVILDDSEKMGGRRFLSREGDLLKNFLHEAGGVDLGFQGVRCTWQNARKGEKNIRKRLDRGIADSSCVARAVWFQSAWGIRVDDLHWEEMSHFGCWWAQVKDERLLLFSACLCEMIWKWRNKIIFQGCPFSLAKLISDINLRVKEMEMRLAPLNHMDRSEDIDVELVSQNNDNLQCFFSDASILNGVAGVAAVKVNVADVGDSLVASRFHTVSGVLEGELLAILLALQMACKLGAKKIKVQSDSKVAIMALKNGCLPYAWGTYPVFESCRCICKCFDLVVFAHCPRSENRVADAVAGWARCAMACSEGMLKDLAPAVAAKSRYGTSSGLRSESKVKVLVWVGVRGQVQGWGLGSGPRLGPARGPGPRSGSRYEYGVRGQNLGLRSGFEVQDATVEEGKSMKAVLEEYSWLSGQQINFAKSSLCVGSKIKQEQGAILAAEIGVKLVECHTKYLGLPASIGKRKKEVFESIRSKIRDKLQGWKASLFSQAGREVLLKAVIQAIPTYVMSCFRLPKELIKDIHGMMARFWWGSSDSKNKIHWGKWDKLCKPKDKGGMGFKNLEKFNQSLLAKQGWKIINNPHSLLARVLKACYYTNSNFLEAKVGGYGSFMWRSILWGRQIIDKGIRWRVQSGREVRINEDKWLPRPTTFSLRIPAKFSQGTTLDQIKDEQGNWKKELIEQSFHMDDIPIILGLAPCFNNANDDHVWHFTPNGIYTVKSGYRVAATNELEAEASTDKHTRNWWNKIWKLEVPPKVRNFIWRVCNGWIPVKTVLRYRGMKIDSKCCWCGAEDETIEHSLWFCPSIKWFWKELQVWKVIKRCKGTPLDMLLQTYQQVTYPNFILFIIFTWLIWNRRNKKRLNLKLLPNELWANWAQLEAEELLNHYHSKETTLEVNPNIEKRWEPPKPGVYCLNNDTSVPKNGINGGLGALIRNHLGEVVAAEIQLQQGTYSVEVAEVLALRMGIQLAIKMAAYPYIIQTDCLRVVNYLNRISQATTDWSALLDDIRETPEFVHCLAVQHISRDCNRSAHSLAKEALVSNCNKLWEGCFPFCASASLTADLPKLV
uniref:RNase H type-1 domain-containing protein n=1 Tax=Cannabis sativa TaxID=3483 RepID=A0A803NWY3_CANSA